MSQQLPERMSGGAVDLSHLAATRQAGAAPQRGPAEAGGGHAGAEGAAGALGSHGGQTVDVPSLVLDVSDQTFEQVAQLSGVVPVVFHLRSDSSEASVALDPILESATRAQAGKVLLARVEAPSNPGLMQAFGAQGIPAVVALVAGRPVPLFQGSATQEQIRDLFVQLVQLAEQQGVTGRVNAPDAGDGAVDEGSEPAEPPVNPAHAAALEAIERGDYSTAVTEYERVLQKAPADAEARAALVQVRLLDRLQGVSLDEARAEAAANPTDIDAQLLVADLDVSGGHVEDAFLRLLERFENGEDEHRTRIRERLLELFEVVGQSDSRVTAARTRLANLLY